VRSVKVGFDGNGNLVKKNLTFSFEFGRSDALLYEAAGCEIRRAPEASCRKYKTWRRQNEARHPQQEKTRRLRELPAAA
jgi:hypothetical protein